MPTCTYGTEINPLAKNLITFGDIASLIGLKTIHPWVWTFLSIVQLEAHGMADECSSVPTINDFPSEQDWCDIGANFGGVMSGTCAPADPGRALGRFKEWIISLAWPYFCQCAAGPVGTCPVDSWSVTGTSTSNTVLPKDPTYYEIPVGATQIQWRTNTFTVTGGTWDLQYGWADAAKTSLSSGASISNQGSTLPLVGGLINIPTVGSPKYIWLRYTRGTGSGTLTASTAGTLTFSGSCAARGTPYVPPSAPANPPSVTIPVEPTTCTTTEVCQRVADLQIAVQRMSMMLTLVQRQNVPFSYIPGASHASLTGNGSFAVQGILGLSVDITASPSWLGGTPGTPPAKFEYGWLSIGTADGWQRSVQLVHDKHLILDVSPAATLVGYTLTSGVTATIKELIREP